MGNVDWGVLIFGILCIVMGVAMFLSPWARKLVLSLGWQSLLWNSALGEKRADFAAKYAFSALTVIIGVIAVVSAWP
jgi:hypothetical protein